jgi:hypothetical protein
MLWRGTRIAQAIAAVAWTSCVGIACGAASESRGITLDSVRFALNGQHVLAGVYAGNLTLDALSLGDATFTREESTIHGIAAVRVWVRASADGSSTWRLVTDEELVAGAAAVRIASARDLDPPPTTAIDALSGLSVSSMLLCDGSADVRIDIFFPTGIVDDRPERRDRMPEALLVGPPPSGNVTLAAILAGDIDDPTVAAESVTVDPADLDSGRSGVAILWRGAERATPIAFAGYDLNDLGASRGGALGYRLTVPRGVTMACKLFGLGEASLQTLATNEERESGARRLERQLGIGCRRRWWRRRWRR